LVFRQEFLQLDFDKARVCKDARGEPGGKVLLQQCPLSLLLGGLPHEGVVQQFGPIDAFAKVFVEQPNDEIIEVRGHVVGLLHLLFNDQLGQLDEGGGLEWGLAHLKQVEDDSQTQQVQVVVVDVAVVVDQFGLGLEVAVDDAVGVKLVERLNQLLRDHAHLHSGRFLSSSKNSKSTPYSYSVTRQNSCLVSNESRSRMMGCLSPSKWRSPGAGCSCLSLNGPSS
jgi:hypothetical protein